MSTSSEPDSPVRVTVDEYHTMIQMGVLGEDDPLELLEGRVVPKAPKSPAHCVSTGLVREAIQAILPSGWYVDSQEPITLAASEPEPDVTVVRGRIRDYSDHHPGADDLALVVEVADASLQHDRTSKKRVYARAGVPVFWILNLSERQLEVFADPTGPAEQPDYRRQQVYRPSETAPVLIEGSEIGQLSVSSVLP
jgi:hypothetical protein